MDEFAACVAKQAEIEKVYEEPNRWAGMCLMNIANSGQSGTGRTIANTPGKSGSSPPAR